MQTQDQFTQDASPNPFPPLDPDTIAALRESIRRFGVFHPIAVDLEGNVLDGHHRFAIATELEVLLPLTVIAPMPSDPGQLTRPEAEKIDKQRQAIRKKAYEVIESFEWYDESRCRVHEVAEDADPAEIARSLNVDRRHLSPEQRRAFAVKLSAEGKPLRAIAKATGVSHMQVHRDLKAVGTYVPLTAEDVIRNDPGVTYHQGGWVEDSDGHMYRKNQPKRKKPVSEATKANQRQKQCRTACIKYIKAEGWEAFEALVAELALIGKLSNAYGPEAGE